VVNEACVADIQVTPVAVNSAPVVGPYVIEVMLDVWPPKLVPVKVSVVAVLGLMGFGEMAVITGAVAARVVKLFWPPYFVPVEFIA